MTKEELVKLGLTEDLAKTVAEASATELKEFIPKSRFNEVSESNKTLKTQMADRDKQLEALKKASGDAEALKTKIEELQDRYEDLILDGKKDEARKVRKQVDAMREELVEYQTSVKSDAARKAAVDELSYNAQLAGFEAKYPALNPEHEDFDEDQTNEVATLLNAFVKSGTKRPEALAKAVKYVLGAPPEQKVSDAAKALAEERAKKAREKAAEADKKQPPSSAKVGLDSDKAGKGGDGTIDVMRLSQEKFAKLDEETKAKLRGDEL